MSKHKVKKHHWIDGKLEQFEVLFDTLEEAIAYADETDAHMIKVYSPDHVLLWSKQITVNNTYA